MAILLDPSCSFKAVIAEYIIWQNKKSKSRLELYMKQEKKTSLFFVYLSIGRMGYGGGRVGWRS
jgi:hypothetical protein